jgi:hypothetical protein
VEEVSVVGNITVGSGTGVNTISTDMVYTTGLLVGGLAGLVQNTALRDLDYKQGTVSVTSNQGTAFLGGAIGKTYTGADVNDCSMAGNFTITKTNTGNTFYIGGFVGDFYSGTANNCYSLAPVMLDMQADQNLRIGGFAGRINAPISYCYAKADINVAGQGEIRAAGFSAMTVSSPNTIQYCYATGNVNVVSEGNKAIYAAGFITVINMNIENCYALGNVFVDKQGDGTIHAGGLVADANSGREVTHCFAVGSVTVHRNGTGGTTNAGGLVGNIDGTHKLQYSAALGASVTATGTGTRRVGRVIGNKTSTGTISNNHAYNDMKLYSHNDYDPGGLSPIALPSTPADNGASAGSGTFKSASFWQTTLGFPAAAWDFSAVTGRGYPRLRASPNGTVMGGQ